MLLPPVPVVYRHDWGEEVGSMLCHNIPGFAICVYHDIPIRTTRLGEPVKRFLVLIKHGRRNRFPYQSRELYDMGSCF